MVKVVKSNGCKVLVVDDDPENREMLVSKLEAKGYLVGHVGDGGDALAMLEGGFDPDLILTDLVMPVMNGWALCDALKKRPDWSAIPVVVLAAMTAEQAGKLRVEGAFEKPTDFAALEQRISALCGL